MCRFKASSLGHGVCLAFVMLLFVSGGNAVASEDGGDWRSTYDVVMLWVNFFILVFLFMKFVKNPLKNYLKGQQEEWSKEIGGLEQQRENMLEKVKKAMDELEEGQIHFDRIKNRIVKEGEKKKLAIIEDAKNQSRLMMDDARRKIDAQILAAKQSFTGELIDEAVGLAMEKLPGIINDNDNDKLIDQYLATTTVK